MLRVLRGNTAIRVSIEGHTDNKGNPDKNRKLSKRRAEAVKSYLVDNGIKAERLETVGWGPDQPIESNRTKAGRAVNRRGEFMIIKAEGAESAGEEAADGDSMDFTAEKGDSGDSMDFTIEEEPEGGGGDSMDFTQ